MNEIVSELDDGLTIATDRVPGARSVAIGGWVTLIFGFGAVGVYLAVTQL